MKFAVFTHVEHYFEEDRIYGYAPYIKEMNIWFKYVCEVEIVAPSNKVANTSVLSAYYHPNLKFTKISSINFTSSQYIGRSILKTPLIFIKIFLAMKRADHIHLRCPGNIGLIACICQIFFPRKSKTAKYAGNWNPEARQPKTYKLQKWILRNTFLTRNMRVLVYGHWPNQTKNILPFFTASFSEFDKVTVAKNIKQPLKFLFVGNLVKGKDPFFAIDLVKALNKRKIKSELSVYGEGELFQELREKSRKNDFIFFFGGQPLEVIKKAYKQSHFLILASYSEGWPKVVAEAMFFGCIPIASSISCVPWMLGDDKRGFLIKGRREREFGEDILNEAVEKILFSLKFPEELKNKSLAAQEWSQKFTLEKFEKEIKKLIITKEVRI